ncbi:hypothetical protein Metme_0896 [Methylomonas methanica MC09]|uniref:Uncharacterized protein n=1 Tax=Methylomonas methanica (strain DSM 25384 / MC09) TaxID=857087 RepID=G0A6N3_METMM|nr:hypothetical protein Metme_0896 [Methylomonas methanica MC09]
MARNYTALRESAQVSDTMPFKRQLIQHGMIDPISTIFLNQNHFRIRLVGQIHNYSGC